MNIDISNAHCGPRIQFPDHAWLRVVSVNQKLLAPAARPRRRTSDRWTFARNRASSQMNVRSRVAKRPTERGGLRRRMRGRFFLWNPRITKRERASERAHNRGPRVRGARYRIGHKSLAVSRSGDRREERSRRWRPRESPSGLSSPRQRSRGQPP